jgi:cytochrome c-type biogenesis protein
MLEEFVRHLNQWIADAPAYAFLGMALWGVCSVIFSPCHLASIPLIVGYVGGYGGKGGTRRAFLYSLLFALGLFVMIALVGVVTAALGRMLGDVGGYAGIIVGAVLILTGLYLLELLPFEPPSAGVHEGTRRGGLGAFLLGLTYGFAVGPCTFAFLAPALAVAAGRGDVLYGSALVAAFGVGHALPIVIAGSSVVLAQRFISSERMEKATVWFRRASGALLVLVGIALLFL